MNRGDVLLLSAYVGIFVVAYLGSRWLDRREDKRVARRRRVLTADSMMRAKSRRPVTMADILELQRAIEKAGPSTDFRLDMIRVPGDTDAEIVDALIGDGHHHRRSEA